MSTDPRQKAATREQFSGQISYLRCVVTQWDEQRIMATSSHGAVIIRITDKTLPALLTTGTQLNVLDGVRCDDPSATPAAPMVITPGIIVVEPDFLVDISAIAACFQDYGHHPLSYLLNRMKPRANTPQILLGNFAGSALDDLIHQPDFSFAGTLRACFRKQALQFCTCPDFEPQQFKEAARQQVDNIRKSVEQLFGKREEKNRQPYDYSRALLEPSFVCEQLGLQGRVDLMTDDMRLLVEQKSGKKWGQYKEDHYIQLLLYGGVLRYNFQLAAHQLDIRLLYSKYPADEGLIAVDFNRQLFREAISLRNRIVAQELRIARDGFAAVMPGLQAATLLERPYRADFFNRYVKPRAEHLLYPLHHLTDTERDYVERMLTFVYREQLAQKIGTAQRLDGQVGSQADLWNMPLEEKLETGNIIHRLTPATLPFQGGAMVVLRTACTAETAEAPNFRRGDLIYLYRYEKEPDARHAILYKGVIEQLSDEQVTVRLNDAQHNPQAFPAGNYAIEHAASDIGTTSAIRSIHAFCTASQQRRALLLGQQAPRCDTTQQLSRSYHPYYDDILLRSKQACDYFLIQGPPGTGKTSMALRFLVEEELAAPPSWAMKPAALLLTAYTNRAVDEICAMLSDAAIDYLRLGSEATCDPRFSCHLLDEALNDTPKLDDIRRRLLSTRVIVGTTSTLTARPFLLQLKRFSLCIVDEASQILEPNIIGLLASDSIGRFILIGDHKQLPAVVQQPDDEPRLHRCRQSLFERLLYQEQEALHDYSIGVLRRQGRMHPDIARFPNEWFYRREQLIPVPCPHQEEETLGYRQPAEDSLDELLTANRVLFLPVTPPEAATPTDATSQQSAMSAWAEATLVADLLRRIYRQYGTGRFDSDRTVGVIVPYRSQIALIRRVLARQGLSQLSAVSIDTVERYQGSQRDVIIYSFAVQQPCQLDFLTANCFMEDDRVIDRKLNVAMTRARRQLIMTGRADILCRNPLFAELIRQFTPHAKING